MKEIRKKKKPEITLIYNEYYHIKDFMEGEI